MTTKTIINLLFLIHTIIYVVGGGEAATATSVVDVDGNQVQANTKYYIFTPSGGGLGLSVRDRRQPCPPNVMQETDGGSMGLPLKIFPADGKAVIDLESDLNLAFVAATTCVQRTVWRLGDTDWNTGRRYVRSDGVVGKPGAETVRNWFKIERFGQGYKIVYCPGVCRECRVECGDVGVFVESGRRWLALGGQPLLIAFKKLVKDSIPQR
ncbi:kunitz trypsin inhibitor 5-like [Salvia splendens]|uniref:kunitz trypsin inhibitor 5-like n=1 Tax=Salvia splendens TaxID=180675 RepID=UPI001C2812B5|nr:kunitz trypsin inhibitor 5-like [Salvia splendens]